MLQVVAQEQPRKSLWHILARGLLMYQMRPQHGAAAKQERTRMKTFRVTTLHGTWITDLELDADTTDEAKEYLTRDEGYHHTINVEVLS